MQIIEIIALIELNYPEELDQFFHGFEFTFLNAPSEVNFVEIYLLEPDEDIAFNERMESFGFSSSFFVVQEVAFYTVSILPVCSWILALLLQKCTDG